MTKKATQQDSIRQLKENLELIQAYVSDIQEQLALLDLAATTKPKQARLLLKLFRQNAESYLSEAKTLAFVSVKRLPNLEKDN